MDRSASDLYSVTDGPNATIYTEKLKDQHCMQLDQVLTSFQYLIDADQGKRAHEKREVISEQRFHKSFADGMSLKGLKEHSLSRKMQLLQRLQEKVNIFSEEGTVV